jgi:dTDP-4-amino-4,6-dideoxygalactose transaminase
MGGVLPNLRSVQLVAPYLGEEEIASVADVLRSGQLAQGPVVASLEREFAELLGVKHAVAVNSGTAAVHCALNAIDIGEDDEVLTTPFTFAASASPILMQRGLVGFVDIDEQTFNVDLERYAAAAGPAVKAVVAVDLFGLPYDHSGAGGLRSRGIAVIEDACQAIGASRDGSAAGVRCDAAAFSFYATKNVITGEGGMLVTGDDAIAASARRFRQHGQGERYEYLELGYNYRLTDVLAAIGRAQLKRLNVLTQSRRANAAFYDEALCDLPGVTVPFVPDGAVHAYHQYTILIDAAATPNHRNRDEVRSALEQAGIATGIYYPKPLHLHPLFGGPERSGEFPVAERVAKQVLSLPIHPALSEADRTYVASVLKTVVGL